MEEYLKEKKLLELQEIIKKIGIHVNEDIFHNKRKLVKEILYFFESIDTDSSSSDSEEEEKTTRNKSIEKSSSPVYKIHEQIGNTGKEGIVYLVTDKTNNKYAMKQFKKTKSNKNIEKEYSLQKQAAKKQLTPQVYHCFPDDKCFVMEIMDSHLIDSMKKQNGNLTQKQQKDLIYIYKGLDDSGVFHGDSNILNYMYKNKKLYIIDFGMGSFINEKLIKKLGTKTPNMTFMTLGMIIKLKELKCPETAYSLLLRYVSPEDKIKYAL